jgi:hypothetical protein
MNTPSGADFRGSNGNLTVLTGLRLNFVKGDQYPAEPSTHEREVL